MKTHAKLAAMGALGVALGCFALLGLVFFIGKRTATGGLDYEHSLLTWISVTVIVVAIMAAHLVYAKQLFAYAKEQERRRDA